MNIDDKKDNVIYNITLLIFNSIFEVFKYDKKK